MDLYQIKIFDMKDYKKELYNIANYIKYFEILNLKILINFVYLFETLTFSMHTI